MESEVKLNQKVWHIEISKYHNPKTSYHKDGIVVKQQKVIGISAYKICVDSEWFHTFAHNVKGKKKESYNSYLNNISVSIRTSDHILGDGVFIDLWTTKKPTDATLSKMVAKAANEINNRYGFIMAGAKDALYLMAQNHAF